MGAVGSFRLVRIFDLRVELCIIRNFGSAAGVYRTELMRIPTLYAAIFATVMILPLPALMFDPAYKTPVGLPVYLPAVPATCADGSAVVVRVHRGGLLDLNTETLKRDALRGRLREVLETRAERLVLVKGDPNLEFGEVAQIIDIARTEADYVALLSPSIEKEERPHCCCLTITPHKGRIHERP